MLMSSYFNNYHKIKSISYKALINPKASISYLQYMTLIKHYATNFITWSYKYKKDIYKNFIYVNDGIDLSKFIFAII